MVIRYSTIITPLQTCYKNKDPNNIQKKTNNQNTKSTSNKQKNTTPSIHHQNPSVITPTLKIYESFMILTTSTNNIST
jgi:hypothetical protein